MQYKLRCRVCNFIWNPPEMEKRCPECHSAQVIIMDIYPKSPSGDGTNEEEVLEHIERDDEDDFLNRYKEHIQEYYERNNNG